MSSEPDTTLLGQCRGGDRDAFGAFYVRHREGLLGYLARRAPAPEIAADLMAETFASALVATLDDRRALPQAPKAWLYEIGRNLLIDALRRGKVAATARQRLQLEPLALEDDDIARIVEIAAGAEMLDDLASELSPEDWELLRARVIDEQPYAELASRLRCSEAVVRKRVSRSIASLRTAVGVDRV